MLAAILLKQGSHVNMIYRVSSVHLDEWNIQKCHAWSLLFLKLNLFCASKLLFWKESLATKFEEAWYRS